MMLQAKQLFMKCQGTLFSGVMLQFGQPFCSEQYSLQKSKFMFTLLLIPKLLYLTSIDRF